MQKDAFLIKLGKQIVSIRKSKGMTQQDLAHACFKERQSIERVENAKTNPTAYYLNEIAEALDISLSELMDF
ncbi:MAG: helix-turn-helix transcriptional regulator [Bacteroidota bacterium]